MNSRWAVMILTIIAAVLRFYGYADWSLSNDELSALARLRFDSFSDLLYNGIRIDGHPPAAQTLLYYWTGMFGNSPASVRFPFVVAGVLSVPMLYLVGKTWFNESAGLLSAATLTALQFPLLYSRICRPYALGLLFILIAAYFVGRILFSDKKARGLHSAGLAVSLALCVYSHYFAGLAAAVLALVGLAFVKKQSTKYYLSGGIGSLVLFAPYIPFFLHQLSLGGVGQWLGKPDADWLPEHLFYTFNESWLVILLVICIAVLGLFYGRSRSDFNLKRTLACLLIFLIPFAVGYVYSIKVNPVLQHSTLLFSFPFGLLCIFGVTRFRTGIAVLFSGLLAIGITTDSLAIRNFYTTEHFGVFKELTEQAIKVKEQHPNALLLGDVHSPFYLDYYNNEKPLFEMYDVAEFKALQKIHELAADSTVDVCLFAWSNKRQLWETQAVIEHHFPKFLNAGEHFNSGWILRGRSNVPLPEPNYSLQDQKTGRWGINPKGIGQLDSVRFFTMSDSVEFGPTLELRPSEVLQYQRFNVLMEAKPELDSTGLIVVYAISSGEEMLEYKGGTLMNQSRPGQWSTSVFEFEIPEELPEDAIIKIYTWLPVKAESVPIRRFDVWLN